MNSKALEWLEAERSGDEEIVAVVENDSCAVDAIQVMTGCTFGKGNLIFRDIGKRAYTFHNRRTGKGVRIVDHFAGFESPQNQELNKSVFGGTATNEQKEQWQLLFQKSIDDILHAPEKDILTIMDARTAPPSRAHVFASVTCSICKEQVMEPRAVKTDTGVYCADCADSRDG